MSSNSRTETKTKTQENPVRLRHCLLCGEEFPSDGPHNHVCKRCKTSQVWRQG